MKQHFQDLDEIKSLERIEMSPSRLALWNRLINKLQEVEIAFYPIEIKGNAFSLKVGFSQHENKAFLNQKMYNVFLREELVNLENIKIDQLFVCSDEEGIENKVLEFILLSKRMDWKAICEESIKLVNKKEEAPLVFAFLIAYVKVLKKNTIVKKEAVSSMWFSNGLDHNNIDLKGRIYQFITLNLLGVEFENSSKQESSRLDFIQSKYHTELIQLVKSKQLNLKTLLSIVEWDKDLWLIKTFIEEIGYEKLTNLSKWKFNNTNKISLSKTKANRQNRLYTIPHSKAIFKYSLKHLSMNETNMVATEIRSKYPEIKSKSQDWDNYLISVANMITYPYFYWQKSRNGEIYPQLNSLSDLEAAKIVRQFNIDRQKSLLEKNRLKTLEYNLIKANNTSTFQNLISDIKFELKSSQIKCQILIQEYEPKIKHRESYRNNKMVEYGIDKLRQRPRIEKEAMLDELLSIEIEINKYSMYVKEAIQKALPEIKTIQFDPYRHSSDGVEFDSNTLFNSNKWFRGEVMKVMREKFNPLEIEQVNCFCLDYSGSMDHKRMRNLFKTIVLIIQSLEGRKTYDAFHFFNSEFVKGAPFQKEYTGKDKIGLIMQKIVEFKRRKLLYSGNGGTNISIALDEACLLIDSYVKELNEKYPKRQFAKSLFIISDGEPTNGIMNLAKLKEKIEVLRLKHDISIKGVYLKSEHNETSFIFNLFGREESIETSDFNEGVLKLTQLMTSTYKLQRSL